MIHFLIRLVVNAVALIIVAYLLPGVSVTGFGGALVAALVLGIVNAILRPILFLLTLPLQLITLGLFTFVINALMFWFVGHLGIGLAVVGFWPAFWGAIVLSIVSYLLSAILGRIESDAR